MKKRRITLSSKAREYIDTENKYLKKRSQSGASKFLALMKKARADLADFANMGLGKDGLPLNDLRLYFADDYILDYQIRGDEVWVLAIRHGRQLDPSVPFDDHSFDEDDDAPPPPGSKF